MDKQGKPDNNNTMELVKDKGNNVVWEQEELFMKIGAGGPCH